jgi:hypothetical protein
MMSYKEAGIEHSISQNEVNSLFFSQRNVDALQHGIRYTIYNKINTVIDNQSERELRVIMRSMYLQYARNLPANIIEQVRELNVKVLDYVIPKLIIEVKQYDTYIKDASSLPVPMGRGLNTSTTGTKFLHLKEF